MYVCMYVCIISYLIVNYITVTKLVYQKLNGYGDNGEINFRE